MQRHLHSFRRCRPAAAPPPVHCHLCSPHPFLLACSCRGCMHLLGRRPCSRSGRQPQQRQPQQRCTASCLQSQASVRRPRQHKPMWTRSCGACRPKQGQTLRSLRASMRSNSLAWLSRHRELRRCRHCWKRRAVPLPRLSCRQAPAGPHAASTSCCMLLPIPDHAPRPSKGRPPPCSAAFGPLNPGSTTRVQAFLDSSKAHAPFQPALAPPGLALSLADQCRVRDRSTIMARQLFAEQGTEFAGG